MQIRGTRIAYCNLQTQSTVAVSMEKAYNSNVEAFREEEYPMLKGKTPLLKLEIAADTI
jgi:hypothetical protein